MEMTFLTIAMGCIAVSMLIILYIVVRGCKNASDHFDLLCVEIEKIKADIKKLKRGSKLKKESK